MHLWAASLFGQKTQTGRVDLYQTEESEEGTTPEGREVGQQQVVWHQQLSIEEARHFAMSILQAAEAAETAEIVMIWLRDVVQVSGQEKLVKLLRTLREIRANRQQ